MSGQMPTSMRVRSSGRGIAVAGLTVAIILVCVGGSEVRANASGQQKSRELVEEAGSRSCGPLFLEAPEVAEEGGDISQAHESAQGEISDFPFSADKGADMSAAFNVEKRAENRCGKYTAEYARQIGQTVALEDPRLEVADMAVTYVEASKVESDGSTRGSSAEEACDSQLGCAGAADAAQSEVRKGTESQPDETEKTPPVARKKRAPQAVDQERREISRPDDLTRWWPEEREGHLNIRFVGGVAFGTALGILTDRHFKDASVAPGHVRVFDANGRELKRPWVTSKNPNLILLQVAPGLYTVKISPEFEDGTGISLGVAASGQVFID